MCKRKKLSVYLVGVFVFFLFCEIIPEALINLLIVFVERNEIFIEDLCSTIIVYILIYFCEKQIQLAIMLIE